MHQPIDPLDGIIIDKSSDGLSPCEYNGGAKLPPKRPPVTGADDPKPPLPLVRLPDWIARAKWYAEATAATYRPVNLAEEADYYRLKMACQKNEDGRYEDDKTPTTTTIGDLGALIQGLF